MKPVTTPPFPTPVSAPEGSANPFALAQLARGGEPAMAAVLVVASNGSTRGGVERRLEEEFEVCVARSYEEARACLESRRFALALVDLRGEGPGLAEVAAGLREADAEMSIIALGAGRAVKVVAEQCLQVPFDSPDLVALAHHEVEVALRRRGRSSVIREMEGVIALLQRELEAKDSLADYGAASASMVHDLRNALCSTLGYTARLIQETSNLKHSVGPGASQPIEQIAHKLEHTSNYLLHLAQTCRYSDAGKPVRERLDLQAEIEHVHAVLFFHSPKVRVTGERRGEAGSREAGSGPAVLGDRYELHRVFQNLFKNAIEAGATDVRVLVRVDAAERRVTAEVSDDGRGFAVEEAGVAFTHALRSSKNGGQGMGLRICRRIVERHGGEIALRSEPGRGAAFTITLPLAG